MSKRIALRHPLAALRAKVGCSHLEYAQLVAEAHIKLGFGPFGAYREKVSRWESGRNEPTITAQLAIAHIHDVPEDIVRRFGWPRWLYKAAGDADLIGRPWTFRDTLEELAEAQHCADGAPRTFLTVRGLDIHRLATTWQHILAASPATGMPLGPPLAPEALAATGTRAKNLWGLSGCVPPWIINAAARGEFELITGLLRQYRLDALGSTFLLSTIAPTAIVCAYNMEIDGNCHAAERYLLAGIRASCLGGARQWASICAAGLTRVHTWWSAPEDALAMADATQEIALSPPPQLSAFLHVQRSLAHARLGDAKSSIRSVGKAFAALPANHDYSDFPADSCLLSGIDERWVAIGEGIALLHLGRPKRALDFLAPLIASRCSPPVDSHRYVGDVQLGIHVVDALLASRRIEEAVHTAKWVIDLPGEMPLALARRYRKRFENYLAVPAARDLCDRLS